MAEPPKFLAGGNPQIPMGDGDAPVQAYIAAMPGWRSGIGRRIDGIVSAVVPGVRKAVKWNSPFYGAPGSRGWFLSVHCYANFVRVAFFDGAVLEPPPPGASKIRTVRYYDIRDGELNETQFAEWVEQAAGWPGWTP